MTTISTLERWGTGFWPNLDQINTTTPAGRLLFHVTGALAEFQRTLMSERTKAGLQAAR